MRDPHLILFPPLCVLLTLRSLIADPNVKNGSSRRRAKAKHGERRGNGNGRQRNRIGSRRKRGGKNRIETEANREEFSIFKIGFN